VPSPQVPKIRSWRSRTAGHGRPGGMAARGEGERKGQEWASRMSRRGAGGYCGHGRARRAPARRPPASRRRWRTGTAARRPTAAPAQRIQQAQRDPPGSAGVPGFRWCAVPRGAGNGGAGFRGAGIRGRTRAAGSQGSVVHGSGTSSIDVTSASASRNMTSASANGLRAQQDMPQGATQQSCK
jgi:hypothetical protein